ncbi:MAG: hypothetical protein GEV28_33230 [Actinophytocola sp.]|uniref:hypothetical protein n=1 Tax=Actinophytocola sp. TaxID=1872138 RepID=UPI00132B45BE|nr:hypothetical protein [Actinophytocola sp.]MPZ84991.1 hypothetical protein [Actinophytocola sp.]
MTSRKIEVAALLVATVGIIVQIGTGVPGYPVVPPGPIILAAAAIAVLGWRWRWAPMVLAAVPLFVIVGGVIEGSSFDRLVDPAGVGPFLGTALQWVGLVVAVPAGIAASVRTHATVH